MYYSHPNAARRISAAAILRGALAPKALANQVAIVGATAVGISDVVATFVVTQPGGIAELTVTPVGTQGTTQDDYALGA